MMSEYKTVFGSLDNFRKGEINIIADNPKNYVFSNVFEVAAAAKPYERVAVAKNFEYVVECLRAEGTSPWYICAHDEFALCMDGKIEVHLIKPSNKALIEEGSGGATLLKDAPDGKKMGRIVAARGHMAMLPAGSAYRFHADQPSVITIQTIQGPLTVERWSEICITK
jgi:hypothetical protein